MSVFSSRTAPSQPSPRDRKEPSVPVLEAVAHAQSAPSPATRGKAGMGVSEQVKRSRELRKNPTDAERRLWRHLRDKQLDNFRFRRQRPIGNYIVDFVCLEAQLVVELDGGQHAEQQQYDARRTAYLVAEGLKVLRYWNNDVMQNVEGVLEDILAALRDRASPRTPSQPSPREGKEPSVPAVAAAASAQSAPSPVTRGKAGMGASEQPPSSQENQTRKTP
jgi:very-short-patch-repair endonuclease